MLLLFIAHAAVKIYTSGRCSLNDERMQYLHSHSLDRPAGFEIATGFKILVAMILDNTRGSDIKNVTCVRSLFK
jgi:hypothetical protein